MRRRALSFEIMFEIFSLSVDPCGFARAGLYIKELEISTTDRTHARSLTHSLTHPLTHSRTHSRPQTHTSRGAGSEAHEVLEAVLGPNDREAVLRARLLLLLLLQPGPLIKGGLSASSEVPRTMPRTALNMMVRLSTLHGREGVRERRGGLHDREFQESGRLPCGENGEDRGRVAAR